MPVINRIAEFHDEITAWRHDIHRHPELAFEERRTTDFVAAKLAAFGTEVHRGLAKTGVVGVLKGQGEGGRGIGLRADLDALPIEELNDVGYKSQNGCALHNPHYDFNDEAAIIGASYWPRLVERALPRAG